MTSLELAIIRTSEELGLSSELVGKVYRAYWMVIKLIIQSLPLKEDISEEEFKNLRSSINIPSLGKLNSSYNRVLGVKRRFKYLQLIRDYDKDK